MSGGTGQEQRSPRDVKEEERLIALEESGVVDVTADALLDQLVKLLAEACGRPMAALVAVERDETIVKAAFNIPKGAVPNKVSFSHYIITGEEDHLVVPDMKADPRFSQHPMVLGPPLIRYTSGVAVCSGEGSRLGVLAVSDTLPSETNPREEALLRSFAQAAAAQIQSIRIKAELLQHLHLEREVYNRLIRSTMELAIGARNFDDAISTLIANLDPELGWLSVRMRNMQTGGTTGIRDNPRTTRDPEVAALWKAIDSAPMPALGEKAVTTFVASAPMRPEYSFLRVPVHVRGRLVAVLEFLYFNHLKSDARIRQVYALMASNLALVAERELINLELVHNATHDTTTEALTHPVFVKEIELAIREIDTRAPSAALIYIDFERLGEVNTNFGHRTGDLYLVEIARRLRWMCRDRDQLGRFGGAEFCLLVRGLREVIAQLRDTLGAPVTLGDLAADVSMVIGAVMLEYPEVGAEDYLRRAEDAMKMVKDGEAKDYCIATNEIVDRYQKQREINRQFREGVKAGRFNLHYQPIVELATGRIVGAEALLRLVAPDGSLIPAATFMPAVRNSRFLPELDNWVLDEVVFNREKTSSVGHEGDFYVSVNVNPLRLASEGYAQRFLERLLVGGLDPGCMKVEILESELDTSNAALRENLRLLHEAGVHIAVDDFGTGYSNLKHLATLPLDAIKIDRVFLAGIGTKDRTSNALLAAINSIGKELGYHVIAEGVETEAQADYLRKLGVARAQGYYFGKPMPWQNFLALLGDEKAGTPA